jgi:hypothetical protein
MRIGAAQQALAAVGAGCDRETPRLKRNVMRQTRTDINGYSTITNKPELSSNGLELRSVNLVGGISAPGSRIRLPVSGDSVPGGQS